MKKFKIGFLIRIYKWSRISKYNYFTQRYLTYLFRPIRKKIIKKPIMK